MSPESSVDSTPRWVVIGASGFVGRAITDELERRGAEILRVNAPRLHADRSLSAADLIDLLPNYQEDIDALACRFRAGDIVINAAGVAEPDSPASARLFGANGLLPGVVVKAACLGGARHLIHLSSAAVQGNAKVLDATSATSSFSPYSESKAKGESVVAGVAESPLAVTIVRATSVQGPGRRTTQRLQEIARSRLASVASPGTQPTSVSSIYGLVDFVLDMAFKARDSPQLVLQPWEGGTVQSVLEIASGGKKPLVLPAKLCSLVVTCCLVASKLSGGRYASHIRRLELMWFGQRQDQTGQELVSGLGAELGLMRALGPSGVGK